MGSEGLSDQGALTSGAMDLDGNMDANAGGFGRKWSSELGRYVDNLGCRSHDDHPPFFTPSYLKHSRHARQLKEKYTEHIKELQENARTNAQQQAQLSDSRNSSNTNLTRDSNPGITHRGVAQDVVERLSPSSEMNKTHPLPTRWNSSDKQPGLDILGDGSEIRFNGTTRTSDEAAAVRTDYPMPRECGLYYFEVIVLSKSREGLIGIGFSTNKVSLNRLPGWEQESWAYHGDDGFSFACHASGKAYGPKFAALDVIGCGVNYRTGNAFFTKNGVDLGTAFTGIKTDKLYPSVGMKKPGEHIRANFGKSPFMFDIDGYMAEERKKVFAMMETADVSTLHPPDDKDTLVQKLIGQYLIHEGYVGTARAFAEDLEKERQSFPRNPGENIFPAVTFRDEDDVNAINRQKIRKAILDGDIDRALKYTSSYYPNVLKDDRNREVYFKLRCRKFIEMMRKYTEMLVQQQATSPNGHQESQKQDGNTTTTEGDQDQQMDVDDQLHREAPGDDEDAMQTSTASLKSTAPPTNPQDHLAATLAYGRTLETDFGASQPEHTHSKAEATDLRTLFALIAYRDPYASVLAPLLSKHGRVELGEKVNAAILTSLGQPAAAALEVLAGQTETLLAMAGAKGGAAAFVGVQGDMCDVERKW